ncbi:MAG: Gx transporter family protein [Lachnospiraceae bacterium]|nr:Gx transporter family protein [Lachnospiraceae bacterium]
MELNTNTKKIALLGVLTAAAFILNYLESLLPVFIPVPGVKIGLANIAVLVALYVLGMGYAGVLAVVRIVLAGFTFGSLFSMLYSFAGCLLSMLVMLALKRIKRFSVIGVSVAGGVAHNMGQLLCALFLVGTSIFYYAPFLIASGVAAGLITGAVVKLTLNMFPPRAGNG